MYRRPTCVHPNYGVHSQDVGRDQSEYPCVPQCGRVSGGIYRHEEGYGRV